VGLVSSTAPPSPFVSAVAVAPLTSNPIFVFCSITPNTLSQRIFLTYSSEAVCCICAFRLRPCRLCLIFRYRSTTSCRCFILCEFRVRARISRTNSELPVQMTQASEFRSLGTVRHRLIDLEIRYLHDRKRDSSFISNFF
jgi:hypothetical protein